jgi:DNA-directed RNA polymerase specialized sigma24 family protein
VARATVIADLVQEVFVRAFSTDARHAYDGRREYGHYLAAIARNCFIDLLRARRREILIDPEDSSSAFMRDTDLASIRAPFWGVSRTILSGQGKR